ncbi:MAG: type II/IV secretion system protein [Candidatus Magasanikbacteria bacterium]|nr:type II/IV secretion system protein [Candidatus Magasanikbacteria bacterium]
MLSISDDIIKDLLLKGNYVTEDDVKAAEAAKEKNHVGVVDFFLAQGLVTKDLVGQAMAESFKATYADLNSAQPSAEQTAKIPEEIAVQFRVVFFNETKKGITVATDNPVAEGLGGALKKIFGSSKVSVAYALPEDIEATLIHYRKKLSTRFTDIIKVSKRVAPELIDAIIEDAVAFRCSDIHFEPQDKDVEVRFRVDGVLHEAGRIPTEHYDNVLNRVKVQAHLRIDDHFSAQDGAIRYTDKNKQVLDFRVSILPTLSGEKIVLRVLSQYIQGFALGDVGLSAMDQELFFKAAKKPFGMILVTGPTGSGKTTTLYALLKTLNRPEVNITTIEDPVEYHLPGINQIQINTQTNLTFAKGLRSIARQDPDIILVGEIRDGETAEIAVNAALTGHLLLSTFHANDAATALPRLLDMGIEPFLLASTLEVVIAQRLVRKICENCRHAVTLSPSDIEKKVPGMSHYFSKKSLTLYAGKGCANCGQTGFKGRTAVFEFIPMTPEMKDLLLQHPSTKQIWDLAQKQGARSMFEDGVEKIKNGLTTIEELARVAAPPEIRHTS